MVAKRSVRAAALAAAFAAALGQPTGATECRLAIRAFPDGSELAHTALDAAAPEFALTYRHSVTLSLVTSRYTIEDGRIVHLAEAFADHGPGLSATAEAPGARWERRDGRFILHERRVIDRLVLRVQRDFGNRLDAAETVDLARWGDRAIEIVPLACATQR